MVLPATVPNESKAKALKYPNQVFPIDMERCLGFDYTQHQNQPFIWEKNRTSGCDIPSTDILIKLENKIKYYQLDQKETAWRWIELVHTILLKR